jgi:hypothetical protein
MTAEVIVSGVVIICLRLGLLCLAGYALHHASKIYLEGMTPGRNRTKESLEAEIQYRDTRLFLKGAGGGAVLAIGAVVMVSLSLWYRPHFQATVKEYENASQHPVVQFVPTASHPENSAPPPALLSKGQPVAPPTPVRPEEPHLHPAPKLILEKTVKYNSLPSLPPPPTPRYVPDEELTDQH